MVTLKREETLDLTILTGSGTISAEEVVKNMDRMYADSPTKLVLWDFGHADVTTIGFEEVKVIAELAVKYGSMRQGGKTAIIVAQQVAFGIGRVYESLVNDAARPLTVKVFWTREEALEFLGIEALPGTP